MPARAVRQLRPCAACYLTEMLSATPCTCFWFESPTPVCPRHKPVFKTEPAVTTFSLGEDGRIVETESRVEHGTWELWLFWEAKQREGKGRKWRVVVSQLWMTVQERLATPIANLVVHYWLGCSLKINGMILLKKHCCVSWPGYHFFKKINHNASFMHENEYMNTPKVLRYFVLKTSRP